MFRSKICYFALLLASSALAAEHDSTVFVVEHFERHMNHDDARIDLELARGNDERSFVAKFSSVLLDQHDLTAELRLTYSQPLNESFDWHAGVIAAWNGSDNLNGLALGVNGNGIYAIETEVFVSLDENGEFFAFGDLKRDFGLSEKWIAKPTIGFLVGHGADAIFAEARLRYQASDDFAPYIGVLWEKVYDDVDEYDSSVLVGITLSF